MHSTARLMYAPFKLMRVGQAFDAGWETVLGLWQWNDCCSVMIAAAPCFGHAGQSRQAWLHVFLQSSTAHLCASSTTSYNARWYLSKVPLTGQVRETSLQ